MPPVRTNECGKCEKVQGDICRNKNDIATEKKTREDREVVIFGEIGNCFPWKYAYVSGVVIFACMVFLFTINYRTGSELRTEMKTEVASLEIRINVNQATYNEINLKLATIQALVASINEKVCERKAEVDALNRKVIELDKLIQQEKVRSGPNTH